SRPTISKTAPPNKSPKKKAKEDKGKSIDIGEFTNIPTIPHVPYPFALDSSSLKTQK
ncbi:hypothetical protein PIB30_081825, partial [Stylosanthes scabra]|nr:hypothetical protein [Stylosanthes scabra]